MQNSGFEEPWPSNEDDALGVGDFDEMMANYRDDIEAVYRGTPPGPLQPDPFLPTGDHGAVRSFVAPVVAVVLAAGLT